MITLTVRIPQAELLCLVLCVDYPTVVCKKGEISVSIKYSPKSRIQVNAFLNDLLLALETVQAFSRI